MKIQNLIYSILVVILFSCNASKNSNNNVTNQNQESMNNQEQIIYNAIKANGSIGISAETLSENLNIPINKVEELFNEAFYLINSVDIDRNDDNYCSLIERDPQYLQKNKFRFWAKESYDIKAVNLFSKIIETDPNFFLAYLFRSIAKYKTDKYEDAVADFTKAIEIDWYYSSSFYNRSIVREKIGDTEGAKKDMVLWNSLTKGK